MRSLPYCSELQTLLSLEMDQVVWILNLTVAEPHKTLGKLVNYTIKALHLASSQKFVFTSQTLELISFGCQTKSSPFLYLCSHRSYQIILKLLMMVYEPA